MRQWIGLSAGTKLRSMPPVSITRQWEPDEARVFGEQLGPGRSSRAMAIVHIAIFEAVNAIASGYESYVELARRPWELSLLRPSRPRRTTRWRRLSIPTAEHSMRSSPGTLQDAGRPGKNAGIALGRIAASAILQRRIARRSEQPGQEVIDSSPATSRAIGVRIRSACPDSVGRALGRVAPSSYLGAQFRVPPPPAMTSTDYAALTTK